MSGLTRRDFLKISGAAATSLLPGCMTQPSAPAKPIGRVIVIGGGFGGATAAKYLRMWSGGAVEVFLIERNAELISRPTAARRWLTSARVRWRSTSNRLSRAPR